MLRSDLHHSKFFLWLSPALCFGFLASSWLDVQSPRPDAGYLAGRCAAPPIAVEVHSDVYGAYHAHATTISSAHESSTTLDVINIQCFYLPTVSCFLLGCCSLDNRRDQLSGPCLSLTDKVPR